MKNSLVWLKAGLSIILKRNKANPSYLASITLNKLIFGDNNILAIESVGTEASVDSINN